MEPTHFRQAAVVEFGETDASGWMHFPNIFRHVERAEHAFLRSLGVVVFDRAAGGWPRARVECDFKRPLQAGEAIEVRLAIERLGTASISWKFAIHQVAGEIAAAGRMTTVRVGNDGRPIEIPPHEREALAAAGLSGD